MSEPALINGEPNDHISISNRGLSYGDGLFETVAVVGGQLRYWDAHVARLLEGCRRLDIAPPDPAALVAEARQLMSGRERAVLKIMVTRGEGGRGYTPEPGAQSTRIIQVFDWPNHYDSWRGDGLRAGLCVTPLGINSVLAGIKHLNRLEQVLGAAECAANHWDEGLMFSSAEELICGTKTNVFVVDETGIKTPLIDTCGVKGVMRGEVIEAAVAAGIDVVESRLTRAALFDAGEIFVTNAIIGLAPLRFLSSGAQSGLHDREFTDFPVTARLQQLISE